MNLCTHVLNSFMQVFNHCCYANKIYGTRNEKMNVIHWFHKSNGGLGLSAVLESKMSRGWAAPSLELWQPEKKQTAVTCTRGSGSPNFAARFSRAAMSGYWQAKNDLSSPSNCCAVNAVLPLRCFLDMTIPGSDGTSTSPVLPAKSAVCVKIASVSGWCSRRT